MLCADDFGQNAQISAAIVELAQLGRVTAVSCMVNGGDWPEHLAELKKTKVQIGLHLNFTHAAPLTWACQQAIGPQFPSLIRLLLYHFVFKKIDEKIIFQEITAQISKFNNDVGFYPQFIDGHQHVHQLPFIAKQLLAAIEQFDFHPWLRTTYTDNNFCWSHLLHLKRLSLYLLGGRSFAKLAQAKDYATNEDFSGDYVFTSKSDYAKQFRSFLPALTDNALIMCHPGYFSNDGDRIAKNRVTEFNYLHSKQFLHDLAAHKFMLSNQIENFVD